MARQEKNAYSSPAGGGSIGGRKRPRVRGGGWASLLFLGGVGLSALGVGLVTADRFSWQLVKVRRLLEPYGVEGASLALAGVVVLGASLAARAAVSAAKSLVPTGDDGDEDRERMELVTGQLATDLASLRQSLARVGEAVGGLAAGQSQALARLEQLAATPESGNEQRDGLFRLAASLDKLGAQMDERLHGLDSKIREKIDHVATAIDQARSSMEMRLQTGPSASASAPASASASASAIGYTPFGEEPPPPARPQGIVYVDEGQGATQQELDVLVELEKELLEGKEPNLEFFDAVEELEGGQDGAGSEPLQLDLESPPSPFSGSQRKPLDVLMPDDK